MEAMQILTYTTNENLIYKILKFFRAVHLSGLDKLIPSLVLGEEAITIFDILA